MRRLTDQFVVASKNRSILLVLWSDHRTKMVTRGHRFLLLRIVILYGHGAWRICIFIIYICVCKPQRVRQVKRCSIVSSRHMHLLSLWLSFLSMPPPRLYINPSIDCRQDVDLYIYSCMRARTLELINIKL